MHVVPDVVGPWTGGLSLDIALRYPTFPAPPARQVDKWGWLKKARYVPTRDMGDEERVIPGALLSPKETMVQPELEIRYFDRDSRLHTILMVDPGKSPCRITLKRAISGQTNENGNSCIPFPPTSDVPDLANYTYTTFLHWLVPNVELSASTRVFPSPSFSPSPSAKHVASLPEALVSYLPPHPHKGSDSHRYTFLVVSHPKPIDIVAPSREGFNFRSWLADLQASQPEAQVEGMTFVRAEYDAEACAEIWDKYMRELKVLPINVPLLVPATFTGYHG